MQESEGPALPAIVVVGGLTLLPDVVSFAMGSGSTVRPHEWLLNWWLLLTLGVSYSIWAFLRARGTVDPLIAVGVPFLIFAALMVWMYWTLAHKPGGQPIGALERVFAKVSKRFKKLFRRRGPPEAAQT